MKEIIILKLGRGAAHWDYFNVYGDFLFPPFGA